MRAKFLLIAMATCLTLHASAWADLVITIEDADIQPGQTATVNVWISGSDDALSFFGYEFAITPKGSTASSLQFVDPQPEATFVTTTNYVLYGDSWAAQSSPYLVGAATTTTTPNDTFLGGDSTNSLTNMTVGGTNRLLLQMQVTANTSLPPVSGDSFEISLQPTSSTFFEDASGTPVPFTAVTATIHAVPEPATVVSMVSAGLALCGLVWFRRRRRAAAPPEEEAEPFFDEP